MSDLSIPFMVSSPATRRPCTLSFCIPTYNRASTVHGLVLRLLQCPAPDIEVVVLDNGSTDDTIELLKGITDERLTVRSNGTNRGVLFNVVNVLLQGRGDYSVLLLDKDSVDPDRIVAFKEFLESEQVACGLCEYNSAPDRPPEVLACGLPALRRIAYTCHHPTGYFFNTRLLRNLHTETRYVEYDYVGHFPFEFILAELALKGSGAVYHLPVFAPEKLHSTETKKSFGTNAARGDAFFSENGRLKMAINFSTHIRNLPIPFPAKRQLVLDCFAYGVVASTLSYRALLRNEAICFHYHIATRNLGYWEMFSIGLRFYRMFVQEVVCASNFRDLHLTKVGIIKDTLKRAVRSLARRLIRRYK